MSHPTDSADQGLIVIAATVSMQFNPVVTEHLDEIQRAGTLRVTGNLNLLSRRQPLKNLLAPAGGKGLQLLQLLRDIDL